MAETGVRELKARASAIIREVRERRARYVVTYRGRAVAVLAPLEENSTGSLLEAADASANAWEELAHLAEEIGRRRRRGPSVVELLSQMRR